jgi:hypothetical protein
MVLLQNSLLLNEDSVASVHKQVVSLVGNEPVASIKSNFCACHLFATIFLFEQ